MRNEPNRNASQRKTVLFCFLEGVFPWLENFILPFMYANANVGIPPQTTQVKSNISISSPIVLLHIMPQPLTGHSIKAIATDLVGFADAQKNCAAQRGCGAEGSGHTHRACIRFLRLFFRWQFRWQHKTTLWPGEESALFRRVSRCVRFFEQSRVCTRFHA